MHRFARILVLALAVTGALVSAHAVQAAKVESVVPNAVRPLDPGCVAGPIDLVTVENWYVEQGRTYTIHLSDVTNCANGGTDTTIVIEIDGLEKGDPVFVLAVKLATGEYQFDFTMPSNACGPYRIKYCLYCIEDETGFIVEKQTGGGECDLFPAEFSDDCSTRTPVHCPTPVEPSTWGTIKGLYR